MFASKILIRNGVSNSLTRTVLRRYLTTLYEKDITVTPFCSVNVKLPFDVTVVPLDVHKYRNCDKVIIKVLSQAEHSNTDVQYHHDNDTVDIFCNSDEAVRGITCKIEAPVKANINVAAEHGDINLSNFNGENVILKSGTGNITASKCHCNKISISSSTGNITCTSVMQAAEIYLKTGKYGDIATGRLQGLVLKAQTENGKIRTESSYCDDSSFATENGHLDLRSVHKHCKVMIRKKGLLNMTGFDGVLQVDVKEGDADIQIARLQDNSKITIKGDGSLTLKLFDTCLQNTNFKLAAKNLHINEDINLNTSSKNGHTVLSPGGDAEANILIDCRKSSVTVQTASWLEMFNLKLPT